MRFPGLICFSCLFFESVGATQINLPSKLQKWEIYSKRPNNLLHVAQSERERSNKKNRRKREPMLFVGNFTLFFSYFVSRAPGEKI